MAENDDTGTDTEPNGVRYRQRTTASCQIHRVSSDFHAQIRENCQQCQTGSGRCLVEYMLQIEDERPD